MKKKNRILILIVLFISFTLCKPVSATVSNSYTHTKSSGYVPFAYQTYGARLRFHYLNGTPAYCLQWDYNTYSNVVYTLYNDNSSISERKRYIVGKAIQLINADSNLTEDQKYTYATHVANCVFDVTGSRCSSSWKAYKTYVTQAEEAVAEMQLCTGTNTSNCFNSGDFGLSLEGNNYTLKKLGNTSSFISSKITLTGLLESYGGTETNYSISIENCPSGSTCSICTDAWGSNCESSKTLKSPTSNFEFYVKVSGSATANASFKVRAKGSNSATIRMLMYIVTLLILKC